MRKALLIAMLVVSACSRVQDVVSPTPASTPTLRPTGTSTVISDPVPRLEQVVTLAPTDTTSQLGFNADTDDPVCCSSDPVLLNRARLLDSLRNATLAHSIEHAPEFTLTDWMYLYQCTDGPNCYAYLTEPIAYGDLDDDGSEDLAGVVVSGYGGDVGYDLVAVLDRDGDTQITPLAYVGSRIDFRSLDVLDGGISVSLEMYEINNWEQPCWEDGQGSIVYRYDSGRLVCDPVRELPQVP